MKKIKLIAFLLICSMVTSVPVYASEYKVEMEIDKEQARPSNEKDILNSLGPPSLIIKFKIETSDKPDPIHIYNIASKQVETKEIVLNSVKTKNIASKQVETEKFSLEPIEATNFVTEKIALKQVEINYMNVSNASFEYLYNDLTTSGIKEEELEPLAIYEIENGTSKKTYEPYTAFGTRTNQYKLQQMAKTDENGLRVVGGRYCVAIGSYFGTSIGQWFDITLKNGEIIPCVMGDQKADCDTDERNMYTVHSNCFTEFIVDIDMLSKETRRMGSIAYQVEEWNSDVVSISVYDKNALTEE